MAMSHKGPPPLGGDETRAPAVLATIWAESVFCAVIIGARFYTRRSISQVHIEDWLMLVTLLIFFASAAVTTVAVNHGGYRHVYYLDEQQLIMAGELNFILRALVILSYTTGKASVGALILRIMGVSSPRKRWTVWVTMVITAMLNIVNCIFNFVQCIPVQANWSPGMSGKCWDPHVQTDFAYFMSAENVLADVILAILPATFLYKLNMSFQTRIKLSVILGLGLLAAVCGIVKITTLKSISADPDYIWSTYALTVWGMSETFIIMVCGSIPALKPLWDRWFGKPQTQRDTYTGSSRPYIANASASYALKDRKFRTLPSMLTQMDLVPSEEGSHNFPTDEIRKTTDIEITSLKEGEKVGGWRYEKFDVE